MFPSLSAVSRPLLLACLFSGGLAAGACAQSYSGATLSLGTAQRDPNMVIASPLVTLNGAAATSTLTLSGDTFHTPLQGVSTVSAPLYSQFIIFGDSLSDTGNFAATTEADFGIAYPGTDFNYADGRFTDGAATTPAARKYAGVWHEQLAAFFLGLTPATASLGGGTDYAFGDAETLDGERTVTLESGVSLQVDNMGQQVTNYLNSLHGNAPDPAALVIVWGGANDLFADDSTANVIAAAQRETALVQRLAEAGVKTFLVPNLPPLGLTPEYIGTSTQAALTQAASDFRDQLNADLDALGTTLAGEGLTVKIFRLDLFTIYGDLTANDGVAYGFTETFTSAQGEPGNADHSLFWDDVHPTTAGHFQIAAEAYTLLTGTPVVEVSQANKYLDRSVGDTGAFLLTRTGVDLSAALTVPYVVSGTAAAGTDYIALKGQKKLKAGKRTVSIQVDPTYAPADSSAAKIKLTIEAGAGYTLPVVKTGAINLDTVPPPP